jgi:hypothetical protein
MLRSAHAYELGSAYGDRTRISALRGPCPNRLDERANGDRMYRAEGETQASAEIVPQYWMSDAIQPGLDKFVYYGKTSLYGE